MLNVPTEFPHQGSTAWLRSADGQEPTPCRIVQHRPAGPDGPSVTVAIDERFKAATSTRTVPLADLFATRAQALPAPRRRRKAA